MCEIIKNDEEQPTVYDLTELVGCEHGIYPAHTCPYAEDIHGDYYTLCTCCPECENQCAMDI